MGRGGQFLRGLGTLGLAALGAAMALALHIPAGGLVGSLLTVGVLSVATGRIPQLPPSIRRNAQIVTGTVIGSGVGPHLLTSLGSFWLPGLCMTFGIIFVGLGIGWWVSRRTGLDLRTALLAFSPGGLSEMVLVAPDVGADARLVALIGLVRVIGNIALVPLVLGYLVLRP